MKNLRRLLLTSLLITAFAAAAPLLSSIAEAAAVGGVSTSSQPRAAAVENHDDKSADWGLFVAPFDFSGGTSAPRPGVYGAYAASMMRAMLFAPMTFAVTNTNDSGTGSFRKAINDANANPGTDEILFDLGTGGRTINLLSALPPITEAVAFDGTQALNGAHGVNPRIELNGAGAGAGATGLTITGNGVVIEGLVINRFSGNGILIQGAGGNAVNNCIIGANTAGTAALGNATGIFISNSPNNTIGNASGINSNLISGNTVDGVRIDGSGSTGNKLLNNYIGTGAGGNNDLGNAFNGVVITGAANNTIEDNVLSGNDKSGVAISGAGATGNILHENTIGLNDAETAAIGNGLNGVRIVAGASNNIIGQNYNVGRNVIGASGVDGIFIDGNTTTGNVIDNNYIGVNESGTPFPNAFNGIVISDAPGNTIGVAAGNTIKSNTKNGIGITGASATGNIIRLNTISQNSQHGITIVSAAGNNTIGGSSASDYNIITSNGLDGIYIASGTGNKVLGNAIAFNTGLGIDLDADGVNANDAGDADAGANNLQNFPVLTSAVRSFNGTTPVTGTLNSAANTSYNVQLYAGNSCDPTGFGEGESLLASTTVGTDANGNSSFGFNTNVNTGVYLTATATDPSGNTSEFSQCLRVVAEPPGSLQFSSASYSVNETGNPAATITVTRTGGAGGTVKVNYATSDGTANANADYQPTSGTLTFAPGETSKTFDVLVLDDASDEPDETVNLALSNTTGGATLGAPSTAVLNILDDDVTPAVSINDVSVTEGDSGTVDAVFTISLSQASGASINVNYSTADGTATSGSDYNGGGGSFVFSPGETQKTISVTVRGDAFDESDENFLVNLSPPSNATLADGQGVGTILDDDTAGAIQFSAANYSVNENGGSAAITVTRTGGNATFSFSYATAANGTATAGQDYTTASGNLIFSPGETSKTFNVQILDDVTDEPDETVNLTITPTSGSGATLGNPSTAVLTILDNDATPTISIGDANVSEGDSGTTNATFTVTLNGASSQPVTVNYATADGMATAGQDYTAVSGTLTIPAGGTQTISVPVNGDITPEPNETFFVNLSGATNAVIDDAQGKGTIFDDDIAGTFQFDTTTFNVDEGNATTIAVRRQGGTKGTVTVDYATANGTATAGQDYTAASGTLTFAPGESFKIIQLNSTQDMLDEPDETFNLTLSNPTGTATLGSPSATTIIILDNDPTPTLSINDVSVTEGNSGTTNATFNVTLSAASAQTVTVNYATANGTATQPSDYVAASGTLTFSAGQTSKTISVSINGDTTVEPNETFTVNLSSAANATIARGQGTGTITNDDAAPQPGTFSFSGPNIEIGEAGGAAIITVNRTNGSSGAVTVNYATSNGTATAVQDYTATSGTLNFADGEMSKSFSVPVINDALDEADETVSLSLSNPTGGATLGTPSAATLTIIDNDPTPSLSVNDVTVTEGNSGTTNAVFNVSLSAASGQTVGVNYATGNNSATAGQDYVAASGSLTFAPGETQKVIIVQVTGDTQVEPDESFFVILSGAASATIADNTGICFITNDDVQPTPTPTPTPTPSPTPSPSPSPTPTPTPSPTPTPTPAPTPTPEPTPTPTPTPSPTPEPSPTPTANTVQLASSAYSAFENQHVVEVTVTRAGDAASAAWVAYRTIDGTASQRTDYTATLGTLRFAPGETTKTVNVLLTDDAYVEPDESFTFELSNPSDGVALGTPASAVITVVSDDADPNSPNVIEGAESFVREHYHDFLNREPDAAGLAFWTGEIAQCESRPEVERQRCREMKRINVSAAFFLSIEFKETGCLVYHFYTAALDRPEGLPRYLEFLEDTQAIRRGVVVGEGDWRARLEANKGAFAEEFVSRAEFAAKYTVAMTPAQYADALYAHAGLTPSAEERQATVAEFGGAPDTSNVQARASALRHVAESDTLHRRDVNRAFVLEQYFGYLRRNPNDAPDSNFDGYNFWLGKLDQFGGDFRRAEMVKAFLASDEYRKRFGR